MKLINLSSIVKAAPAVAPLLSPKARYLLAVEDYESVKSADDFERRLSNLVTALYNGTIGNDFIDALGVLISRQLTLAYREAWKDEGTDEPMPDYMTSAAEEAIVGQYEFVDGYYRDIVDAREDKTPIEPLLSRVPMWAGRYTEAYNNGVHLITLENGGKEIWVYGDTDHCAECEQLNGIVAYASEWDDLDVHPQGAPNDKLTCGGWRCQCRREPTDKRRSPKAYDSIMNIVTRL